MTQRCASEAGGDFFDQHLSKMLVAPSFEQGPPSLPPGAGWQPENCSGNGKRLQAGESEASTQSSDGRQQSTQVDRHTERHHSADSDGPQGNVFASQNMASYGGGAAAPPTSNHMHSIPAPPPPAPAAQFDSMQAPDHMSSMMSSQATSQTTTSGGGKYKVGDEVEVWSNSHKRWSDGRIEKLESGGLVSVKYYSPEGAAMVKQMPEGHAHLRHKATDTAPAATALHSSFVDAGVYKVGDNIEIWSNSQQAWCRGSVEKVQGDLVHVKYSSPDGQIMTKLMPDGHEYLRHLVQQVVPPPPPPPGRSSHQNVPPPMAESACRQDDAELYAYVEALENYTELGGSSAMASQQMHRGGASMNQSPPGAKGYRAANPAQARDSHRNGEDVFVAETTSWGVPSGSMALCGMPIKANKKPEIARNEDGSIVARCQDTDRCCRCSMRVGSYFDHTCPRCNGVVCLPCLDDIKFIVASYRCPHCGDQKHNEEALKQTLWYLKCYRNTQRVVGAVPILFAGLFGLGPEAAGQRNAKPGHGMEEEQSPEPETRAAAPAAPRPKTFAAAKGPPPAPPRPKGKASAPAGEEPEFHTRPPADWSEGAGGWAPGKPVGGPASGGPNAATLAAALHKAQAAQSARPADAFGPKTSEPKPVAQGQGATARGANPFSSAMASATGQSPFHTYVPP